MNLPERFDLFCIDEAGQREQIVMIHAAIMGSIERFLSILIEDTAGDFPVWLAPVQVALLPVSEAHAEKAKKMSEILKSDGVRIEIIDATESIGKRIREAELMKIPYMAVMQVTKSIVITRILNSPKIFVVNAVKYIVPSPSIRYLMVLAYSAPVILRMRK